jgi:glutamine amidotransferase
MAPADGAGGSVGAKPVVAVVDYGAGNLRSIRRALEAAGAAVRVTPEPAVVAAADAVVFPGVGAAGSAMARLAELGLVPTIREAVADGRPFLGICLGAQLLFGAQEEGETAGLGLLPGRVRRLRGGVKVPHIGWNRSRVRRSGPLGEVGEERDYYFVHSYIVEPDDPADVAAVVDYGELFPSVVVRGNVWGTQFHPEKSGADGLALVRAWVEGIVPAGAATGSARARLVPA